MLGLRIFTLCEMLQSIQAAKHFSCAALWMQEDKIALASTEGGVDTREGTEGASSEPRSRGSKRASQPSRTATHLPTITKRIDTLLELYGVDLEGLWHRLQKDLPDIGFSDIPEWFTEPLPWFYREGGDNWRYKPMGTGEARGELEDEANRGDDGSVERIAAVAGEGKKAEAMQRRQWSEWLKGRRNSSSGEDEGSDDNSGEIPGDGASEVAEASFRDRHDAEWRQHQKTKVTMDKTAYCD